jgi:hypothetical protein
MYWKIEVAGRRFLAKEILSESFFEEEEGAEAILAYPLSALAKNPSPL